MNSADLPAVLRKLRKVTKTWRIPALTEISYQLDPFRVLVSCLLSLRTRDEITKAASKRLFDLADTPQKILQLDPKQVEKAIYPVAFFRNKTLSLYEISETLISHYEGNVPARLDQLLKLKGVGRKTANLTLILGHGKPGICVDTHVHRISNRLRWVNGGVDKSKIKLKSAGVGEDEGDSNNDVKDTSSAEKTRIELQKIIPQSKWGDVNELLVGFGQTVCSAKKPLCCACNLRSECNWYNNVNRRYMDGDRQEQR